MQAAQEGQTRRGLTLKQHEDDREIGRLYPLVECLVVLKHLPIANTLLANQQHEGVCLRDLLGERFRPESSRAQTRRREEYAGVPILALKRGLEPLAQRPIGRMVAQEPPSHSKRPFEKSLPAKEKRFLLRSTPYHNVG